MNQPIALFISIDEDSLVYLNGHPIGYSGQHVKPWQATEKVIAELADMLRERLGWPQTDPRYEDQVPA